MRFWLLVTDHPASHKSNGNFQSGDRLKKELINLSAATVLYQQNLNSKQLISPEICVSGETLGR